MIPALAVIVYVVVGVWATRIMLTEWGDGTRQATAYSIVSGVLWPLALVMLLIHITICFVMMVPYWLFTGHWPWED